MALFGSSRREKSATTNKRAAAAPPAWAIDEYFRINHPEDHQTHFVDADETKLKGFLKDIRDSVPKDKYVDELPVDIDNPPSRYATYSWEIAEDGKVPGTDTQMNGTPVEEGSNTPNGRLCNASSGSWLPRSASSIGSSSSRRLLDRVLT